MVVIEALLPSVASVPTVATSGLAGSLKVSWASRSAEAVPVRRIWPAASREPLRAFMM
jgi:hypothetical protein